MKNIMLITVLAIVTISATPIVGAVGFQTLENEGLYVGIWYPSDTAEIPDELGPFDAKHALNAPPKAGNYQPVLMSHGNSGRMRNHHLTAKALAEKGYIVIAPKHTADHLVGTSETSEALNWRTEELRHALEIVLEEKQFRDVIDLSSVHGLGYSLGAVTIMSSAGAVTDLPSAEEHCKNNVDPEFCDSPSLIMRWKLKWLRDVDPPKFIRDIPEIHYSLPFITGNVALVAPVGQGVSVVEKLFQANSVLIIGLSGDTVTVPRFHAERLSRIVPSDRLSDYVLYKGHHSAFISQFARRITEHEDIPAAKDSPGFDRIMFLNKLNNKLAIFFVSD